MPGVILALVIAIREVCQTCFINFIWLHGLPIYLSMYIYDYYLFSHDYARFLFRIGGPGIIQFAPNLLRKYDTGYCKKEIQSDQITP
jgi:hypothetical protein